MKNITTVSISLLMVFLSINVCAAPAWYNNVTVSKVTSLDAGDNKTTLQIWGNNGCFQQSVVDSAGNNPQFVTNVVSTNTIHLSYIMSMAVSANKTSGKTISFYADCTTGIISQFCIGNGTLSGTC